MSLVIFCLLCFVDYVPLIGEFIRYFSGTCIKDTWTKPKRDRIKSGKWGWLGWVGVVGRKWRQLYFNNNLKMWGKRKSVKCYVILSIEKV